MSKHELCLSDEARQIVVWAGSLIQQGEEIGGIGSQLRRAARLLQLHPGIIWRAYQRRAGPEIYPAIQDARDALVERQAVKFPFAGRSARTEFSLAA